MKKTLSIILSFIMIITSVSILPLSALAEGALTPEMVTFGKTAFVYDGTPKRPEVTVKDGDVVLQENEYYHVFFRINEIDSQIMESAPSEPGSYIIMVDGFEGYEGSVEKEFSIIDDSPSYGTATEAENHVFYVNESGVTSAPITKATEDKNQITWLKEESSGTAAWYGFDNSSSALPEGSTVSVKWFSEKDDVNEFGQRISNLDEQYKRDIEDHKLWLFELDAHKGSGEAINQFESYDGMQVYVEIGDDWDIADIHALFISEDFDENINVRIEESEINGVFKRFAVLTLTHFSTYIIYAAEKAPITPAPKSANPLKVKGKTVKVSYKKLRKKNQTIAAKNAIKFVKKGKGTISYAKAKGNKKILVNKKTGKITVKKGLKPGKYTVKIKVKAAGNASYKAATRTANVTIKVN